jgi:hypothetical protein
MLDVNVFAEEYGATAELFGREPTQHEVVEAYRLVRAHLTTTDEVREVGFTIRSTNRFPPRPVDFLCTVADREWRAVLDVLSGGLRYHELSTATFSACEAFGGREPLATAFERDPIRTRELWLQQLHRELARVAHHTRKDGVLHLPPGPRGVREAGAGHPGDEWKLKQEREEAALLAWEQEVEAALKSADMSVQGDVRRQAVADLEPLKDSPRYDRFLRAKCLTVYGERIGKPRPQV